MSNVFGTRLKPCDSRTGWRRDGFCSYDPRDQGVHTVCAVVTPEFLEYTYNRGNDLITPRDGFPGLLPGDRWCLCVLRWIEALEDGVAPPIILERTDRSVLNYVPLRILKRYQYKVNGI